MTPDDRIATIRRSLRTFQCGLASLLPFVGVLPAACALVGGWRLRHCADNPAAQYVKWGRALGVAGILLTTALVVTAALSALAHAGGTIVDYGPSD
jgi:hypothetical protein